MKYIIKLANSTFNTDERHYNVDNDSRILPHDRVESTFEELFDFMNDTLCFVENKKQGSFIIPYNFVDETQDFVPAMIKVNGVKQIWRDSKGNPYVGKNYHNVIDIQMLPLDIDDGMTIDEARIVFKKYKYIMYSSFNHLQDGKTHKFRILFDLKQPVANDEYVKRTKSILNWAGGAETIDPTCLYRSRGFYLPTFGLHNAENIVLEMNDGEPIDLMEFEAVEQAQYVAPAQQDMDDESRFEILEMLKATKIGTYQEWWQMLQALKSCGYTVDEAIYVTADNPNHESKSTGIKSQTLTRDIYEGASPQGSGIGKLITIIRSEDPNFKINISPEKRQTKDLKDTLKNLFAKTKNLPWSDDL